MTAPPDDEGQGQGQPAEDADPFLDREGVAAYLGILPASVSQSLTRARAKYAALGRRDAGDFPEPDEVVARRHGRWRRSTVDRYRDNRVGRGAPGRTRLPGGTDPGTV